MSFQAWNPDWGPIQGQAVFDYATQNITAVARAPGNLDLFVIGNDGGAGTTNGHAWTTAWTNGIGWNPDWGPIQGQAVFDYATQKIAAVARSPGNLDLFVIGNEGHVWTTAWSSSVPAPGWNADWVRVPGAATFDLNTQHVAAVSRAPDHLDLFVIGNDGGVGTTNGHVWTTAWTNGIGWNPDWGPIQGQAVFDYATQKIAAVARSPGNLDLFVIGNEGHVWTTAWSSNVPAPGWNADWVRVPGAATFDLNTQDVAAVSRTPDNLDLFVIGSDGGVGTTNGHVWTTAWTNGIGWSPDWRPLPGVTVFDRATQKIAAVARSPGNLDLFVIGNEGHVWTTAWSSNVPTPGWNADWVRVPGAATFNLNAQNVVAVSRALNNLDLFVIGSDGGVGTTNGHVWTTAWGPHEANPAITLRVIEDGGRFIEVDGTGFTPSQIVKLGYDITSGAGPTTDQTGQDTFGSDLMGDFVHRIAVNLGGAISGAQAQATDVASQKTATGSL
jgi:hypothetical protein